MATRSCIATSARRTEAKLIIVCRDKRHNELVFVEVKTRSSEDFGRPLDAVDRKKRRLILRGAMTWLRMLDMPDIVFRFDVVEVVMSGPPSFAISKTPFDCRKTIRIDPTSEIIAKPARR